MKIKNYYRRVKLIKKTTNKKENNEFLLILNNKQYSLIRPFLK